ncbi:MAG: hypothetical protein ACE5FH_08815 [Candidatus Zixiibacteriota bacterium]
MQKTTIVVGLLLAVAAVAQAQESRNYTWFVAPEVGFAVSPEAATDYYSLGYGISAGIEYPVSPNWAIIGMVNYKTFSPDEGIIADWWTDPGEWPGSSNISVSEGTLDALTFAVVSKGSLKSPASSTWPYVKGGFGISLAGADQVKVDFTNSSGSSQTAWQAGADSDANVAVLLGFGVEMAQGDGSRSFFAEVGFEIIMLEDSNNPGVVPIRIGMKF